MQLGDPATTNILIGFLIILHILGGMGLIKWMRRQIGALKGTVEAQTKTIGAQGEILKNFEALTKTMQTVLESTDEPKMLERVKAYKEFLEHENQARLQQQAEKLTAEMQQRTQRSVDSFVRTVNGLIDLAGKMMPHIAPEQRMTYIDSVNIPSTYTEIREELHRIAEVAPYLWPTKESSIPMNALNELLKIYQQAESKDKAQKDAEFGRALISAQPPKLPDKP